MMINNINHLYIHVPFCKTICYYCDFCHRVYDENFADKWLEALTLEINEKCKNQYKTIYIGGGTPTSLSINQLEKLLSLIKPYTKEVLEYTIEVNPESLNIDYINLFKNFNINRISMGVQTSDDRLLKDINRKHSFDDAVNKTKLLKQNGFNNISIDLMYSLPNQTIDILNKTIDDFLKLDIPHVSLYSLTIEENTVFGKKGYKPLNEDIEADMYELICNRLKKKGYIHYEVSNFCKQGYESIHNQGYWNYDNFLGVSAGASSKVDNKRWTNTKNINEYVEDFNRKQEDLILNIEDLKFENIMMSLRTIKGLNIEEFNKKYDCNLLLDYKKGLDNNCIYIEDGYLKCSNFEILNTILLDFMK